MDFFWISFGFLLDHAKHQQTREFYCFSGFRLDAVEHRLWFEDAPVALKSKQFDLLFYFVRNAGRVATKSELLEAIWADTFVEETTLARNVSWLRNALGKYSDDETIIETVPKIGYRFTPPVTISESDEDAITVEKQIVQHLRGEETNNFEDNETVKQTDDEKNFVCAPGLTSPPRRTVVQSFFILAAIALVALGGSGFIYWNKKKSVAPPAEASDAAALNRSAVERRQQIKIGSIVNLQNRYPNDGSYLDVWGAVWSKPEFAQVPTQTMFVSTHYNPNRDNGSGSWKIVSASGKSDGEPLEVGDRIHLKNMHPNAGYLDACGWVEHLPVFSNYSNQSGAVFTTKSPDRDNGTGIWIVRSATELFGSSVLEGDSIAIESAFIINDKGTIRISGFLNVAGYVKDIPSFNDYDGSRLIFTKNLAKDQPVIDSWTITISQTVRE